MESNKVNITISQSDGSRLKYSEEKTFVEADSNEYTKSCVSQSSKNLLNVGSTAVAKDSLKGKEDEKSAYTDEDVFLLLTLSLKSV
jgi:hypothetical protein